jgi:hypothetical protein
MPTKLAARLLRRRDVDVADESGVVWALVAVALPLILLIAAFGIDVGHWYDYKRTLQARADAAALAGGDSYGNTCFQTPPPAAGLDAVGSSAATYSGPGPGSTMPAGFPYVVGQTYYNVPNLHAASLDDYTVLFNSKHYANQGGVNYDMATTGVSGTGSFCNSTDETGLKGPMVDVRVTQEHVPLFFNLPFGFVKAINAHARVTVEGVQSENGLTPIAVRDAGVTPCVKAYFINDSDPSAPPLATATLTKVPNTSPAVWTNAAGTDVPMPAAPLSGDPSVGPKVSVETFLWDCNSSNPNGDIYRWDSSVHGLAYINTFKTGATSAANSAPVITSNSGGPGGGVVLNGGSLGGVCDPYFFTDAGATGTCQIGVTAYVAFQPGLNLANAKVTAVDQLTGNTAQLIHGAGNTWATAPAGGLPVAAGSGGHPIEITWSQTSGNVGGACGPGPGNPKPCKGSFGVQQRTVAGLNGENSCVVDPPVDTGPNTALTIGDVTTGTTGGEDVFPYGQTRKLQVTLTVAGLENGNPGENPICMRIAVQNDHQTGLIDCGQGNGVGGNGQGDVWAIENGCPNPLQINVRVQADGSLTCSPRLTPPTPDDCVDTTQGNRPPLLNGFIDRIESTTTPPCVANNWVLGNPITLDDPRAFAMVITAPADLSGQNGNTTIPIRQFAVFYITGWYKQGNKNDAGCGTTKNGAACNTTGGNGRNECFPGDTADLKQGEVWGHWVSLYVNSSQGTPNGQGCANAFGNCIPVLTR